MSIFYSNFDTIKAHAAGRRDRDYEAGWGGNLVTSRGWIGWSE